MKDDTHGLAGMMEEEDFQDLALFVSKGMVDMRGYIDYETKSPKAGDKARGADYFNTICAGCHREDGTRPERHGQAASASPDGQPLGSHAQDHERTSRRTHACIESASE